mmetsp:Transcript_18617/g.24181  ORF Transcript_18617/g.24181 Transcript_18617/m.24181 type:complete len:85 (+) Transcript_18617:770-1024(+)
MLSFRSMYLTFEFPGALIFFHRKFLAKFLCFYNCEMCAPNMSIFIHHQNNLFVNIEDMNNSLSLQIQCFHLPTLSFKNILSSGL